MVAKNQELSLDGIHQYYIAVEKEELKVDVLLCLFGNFDINQAIIFCNTKKRVEELERAMTENDFTVSIMHGEIDQLRGDFIM